MTEVTILLKEHINHEKCLPFFLLSWRRVYFSVKEVKFVEEKYKRKRKVQGKIIYYTSNEYLKT